MEDGSCLDDKAESFQRSDQLQCACFDTRILVHGPMEPSTGIMLQKEKEAFDKLESTGSWTWVPSTSGMGPTAEVDHKKLAEWSLPENNNPANNQLTAM